MVTFRSSSRLARKGGRAGSARLSSHFGIDGDVVLSFERRRHDIEVKEGLGVLTPLPLLSGVARSQCYQSKGLGVSAIGPVRDGRRTDPPVLSV